LTSSGARDDWNKFDVLAARVGRTARRRYMSEDGE
jgi:hypothetical protein